MPNYTEKDCKERTPSGARDMILVEACHFCCVCNRERASIAHHIIWRATGGGNEPDNLIALCGTCHGYAHVKDGLGLGITPRQLRMDKELCKRRKNWPSERPPTPPPAMRKGELSKKEKEIISSILLEIGKRLGIIAKALRDETADVVKGEDGNYRFCFHRDLDIIVNTIEPNIVEGYNLIWNFYGGLNRYKLLFYKRNNRSLVHKTEQLINGIKNFYIQYNILFNKLYNEVGGGDILNDTSINLTFSFIYRALGLFELQERYGYEKPFSKEFMNLSKADSRVYDKLFEVNKSYIKELTLIDRRLLNITYEISEKVQFEIDLLKN